MLTKRTDQPRQHGDIVDLLKSVLLSDLIKTIKKYDHQSYKNGPQTQTNCNYPLSKDTFYRLQVMYKNRAPQWTFNIKMWRSSVRIGTNLGMTEVLIYRYIFSVMALYTVPE